MNISVLLLFIGIFSVSAITYSHDAKISLENENITINEIFDVIRSQTSYSLSFDQNNVDISRKVSIKAKDETVENVLINVLQDQNLDVFINGSSIVIIPKNAINTDSPFQNVKKITGKVINEFGEPIVGCNVVEKGTTNGVITDLYGKFSITISDNATLNVSYIGYETQNIPISDETDLFITLKEDTKTLDEIIVIGYGTVRKTDLSSSVATISNKQFKDQPVKRLEDILQGRTPGVEVTTLSGMPGESVKVRVRGTTSINKSSDPLYVIDGIVSSIGLESLNPLDIQSIEVLKDASATAIYGSRGANGVVLVTTKNGEFGRTQISVDTSIGIHSLMKKYDVMNAYEYATALNDIWGSNTVSAEDLEAYKNGTKGIDWQDIMTRTGISQDYKISLSGGNKAIRYLVSANFLDWEAIIITSKLQKYTIRTNIDTDVKPWLNLSVRLNAARVNSHNPGSNLMETINYSPTMEMKDEETGVYNLDPYNSIDPNPYGDKVEHVRDAKRYYLNLNTTLLFKIYDGLTFSVQGGYDYSYQPQYTFISTLASPGQISTATNSSSLYQYWQNINNLTYHKSFGNHNFTGTAVWEVSKNQHIGLTGKSSNLANESVSYWNLANGSTLSTENSFSEEALASYIARVMYNYKNKYYVTGTFRADGSSKFQGKNKWGYFPSASIAWDAAKENFMEEQNIFQQMKLRASFGITGNQAIDRYSTLGMLSSTSYGWGTSKSYTGYWGYTFATPDVSWEKTYQYDIGTDFSVLHGKINVTLDWFLKQSKDLLFKKSVPMYNGGGSFWVNQGEVKNTGFEFGITTYPLVDGPITWETRINGSYVKNEIVSLAGEEFILDATYSNYGGSMQIMKPGYPYGSFYLYQWEGFDDKGANLYRAADGSLTTSPTANDQVIMGQASPNFTLGWNNSISWKNWTVNVFFNGAFGADRLNISRYTLASMTGPYRFISLREAYYEGWDKVENKADAKFPSNTNPETKYYGNSSFWLEDASFFKLKNVSVSYTIPNYILPNIDLQLNISAQNLLTLTKYKGMDPEVYNSYNGIDYGANPVPRTVTFGAKVTF